MKTECLICGEEFELPIEEFLKIEEDDEYICPRCCQVVLDFYKNLKSN